MVSEDYSEAIVEILDILENSDDTIYKKVPNKLIEFWQRNKSTTYKPNLDHDKPLNEMNLKEKTKDIIAMIYLNYLCDENEKEFVKDKLKKNEENYQLMLREKYNPDTIFEKRVKQKTIENEKTIKEVAIIKYKESIFSKIIKLFKRYLKL